MGAYTNDILYVQCVGTFTAKLCDFSLTLEGKLWTTIPWKISRGLLKYPELIVKVPLSVRTYAYHTKKESSHLTK